jgi:hypothetical protein
MYNIPSGQDGAFIVGNGSAENDRSNLIFAAGNSVQITGSLTVSGSNTFTNIGPAVFSGSINVTQGVTGSLFGTASFASTASFLNNTTNAFIQNGNSFGTTALLGTNDNQSLAFETSGSTRMFISSSGNVGIGTSTPNSLFHLSGSSTATSSLARGGNITPTLVASANSDTLVGLDIAPNFSTGSFTGVKNVGLRLEQGTQAGNNTSNIIFKRTNVSDFATIGYQGAGWNIFGIWGEATFTATNAPDFGVFSGTGHAYIKNNLLINTTSNAGFRLDVNGTARVSGQTTVKGSGATSATTALLVQNSTPTTLFSILDNGNTGIGLATPSASLHISGASSANLLRIYSPASSSIIFLSGSGNV